MKKLVGAALLASVIGLLLSLTSQPAKANTNPIKHIVYILMENHSFDNLLGAWCVQTSRCNGAITAPLYSPVLPEKTVPLRESPDITPGVNHWGTSQMTAVDGGKMDGWSEIKGCAGPSYDCLTQYLPSQEKNMIKFANAFTVEDNTFEDGDYPSWGSHLSAVAATDDGFDLGTMPFAPGGKVLGPGWGCDSGLVNRWIDPSTNKVELVPSCVPDYSLPSTQYPYGGAFEKTPVSPVPTIMDELQKARISWRIYAGTGGTDNTKGYGWATCPTFASCLYTAEAKHFISDNSNRLLSDIKAGDLPSWTFVTPTNAVSEHNSQPLSVGDYWLGQVLTAIEAGPQWDSTAVFLTWDDCGCFYDHVPPPAGLGIRIPLLIISPYAKPGYTDSSQAQYASILRYTEETFHLPALSATDADAYDLSNAFNYSQAPLHPSIHAVITPMSVAERNYWLSHPAPPDPT
jgi:phospholipase C